ncbi:hypothetical protein CLU79DRAFT_840369 [Phycomyces nitens]|nr:hypothetical protein CLU79DRAFT_840369 [Phycomyces nitens]
MRGDYLDIDNAPIHSSTDMELTPNICALCKDWDFYPQINYATEKLFSGCILRNTINGHSILVNTVEVYSRTKSVDIHRESFGKVKDGVIVTSLSPTTFKTLYPGVWPVTLQKFGGMKLIIRTRTSNVLATSSIQLDTKEDLLVGFINLGFQLTTVKDSMATKIFVDQKCIDTSIAMASNAGTDRWIP